MITIVKGNLFHSDAEAIVNPVNTVGAMGKGLALDFKRLYPKNNELYREACEKGVLDVGKVFATETDAVIGTKWVVNFPTKKHFRNPSKLEWIIDGLQDLKAFILEKNIKSIAIPALGVGLGRLPWDDVKTEIEKALSGLHDVDVLVYEPHIY